MNKVVRKETILEKIILSDGQPGNGKSLFGDLLSSFNNVEHVRYSYLLEQVCALYYLKKISSEVADVLIKNDLDNIIYDIYMGRNLNFRYSDITSVFKSVKKIKYLKRLFSKGDLGTTRLITEKKPILNLIVHNLMPTSKPLFEAYKNKVFLLNIVRHPLYMVIQQHLYYIDHFEDNNQKRNFTLMIDKDSKQTPFWNENNDNYQKGINSIDKVISEIYHLTMLEDKFLRENKDLLDNQILRIPFEQFVLNPMPFLEIIMKKFNIKFGQKTLQLIKKHKIPREKVADGLALSIYKRCGWKPPNKNLTEKGELDLRYKYVISQKPTKDSLDILDSISRKYEENYLKEIASFN